MATKVPLADQITARLVDIAGAAKYLGISERHVRLLWQQRRLPAVKIGKLVRFEIAALDEFIANNRVEVPSVH